MRRNRTPLTILLSIMFLAALVEMQTTTVRAQSTVPDLAPMGITPEDIRITPRLGVPTIEFPILTANIGGQDFVRPTDPDNPSQFLLRQLYEYTVYQIVSGDLVEISRQRKNTICNIDDTQRGSVFECLQEHGPRFVCSGIPGRQGVSKGWADDYFRGLTGQWARIGNNVGEFMLAVELDPDYDLQRQDIPDSGMDASHDNNWAYVTFTCGDQNSPCSQATFTLEDITYSFDPSSICPSGIGNASAMHGRSNLLAKLSSRRFLPGLNRVGAVSTSELLGF